ncbi:MAG: hypothetical protein NC818_05490 [Candidatus Omnitrophica bacterium]|nr:hypothetical protein [Candidatus Omnitrophota bacterium]
MQIRKIERTIRYSFVRLFLRLLAVVVYFIPLSFLRKLGVLLGKIFYKVSKYYRQLALNNLRVVFPQKNNNERRNILYKSTLFLGANTSDTLWFLVHSRRRKNLAYLENRKIIDDALKAHKGIIGITAHIGAFTILGGVLSEYGYPVNYILRTPRDEKMANVLGRGLRMQKVRPIFTKPAIRCVERSIEVLRNNEILIILIDQDAGSSGLFVKFFNRYTSAPAGPVILSLRTGANIIPMFILREQERHKLIVYPEFKIAHKENIERTIFDNTQNLVILLQDVIEQYPEQWSWIDRRWRI